MGIHIQNMADFTMWPEMLYFGLLFPFCMVLTALGLYLVVDRHKLKDFGFSSDILSRRVTWIGLVLMLAGFGMLIVVTQFPELQTGVSHRRSPGGSSCLPLLPTSEPGYGRRFISGDISSELCWITDVLRPISPP